MPSPESKKAKLKLQKEQVNPSVSLSDERAAWNFFSMQLPIASSVTVEMKIIGRVECALLTPPESEHKPLILYAHGGGLTAGSIITHRSFASELAKATCCSVVLPEYRLLPENPISAPSDDLIAVYLALVETRKNTNMPIFLGGDSSGAGLAITAMTRLRDQGAQLPSGCFSISGAFDATLSGASMKERDDCDPILSLDVLHHWQSHFGKAFTFDDPLISPLFANLSNLAPTLLMVGEDEVWFDDSGRLHSKLLQAGSVSELKIFEEMWHVWPMTSGLPETEDAFGLILDFVRQYS
ncbi:MAG: alpha/beta hydrolase [Roseibium sp.]